MMEILNGHSSRCHSMFMMQKDVFIKFCNFNMKGKGRKMVAIFLITIRQNLSNRAAQEDSQLSDSAIHKFFHKVLKSTIKMSMD